MFGSKSFFISVLFGMALLTSVGCAPSNMAYSEYVTKAPPPAAGFGRIYMYDDPRDSNAGAAGPLVLVDGQKVVSGSTGFWHYDVPAGEHEVTLKPGFGAAYVGTDRMKFPVAAGQTRYLQIIHQREIIGVSAKMILQNPELGQQAVSQLRHIYELEGQPYRGKPPWVR